ncbi:hypothetical protein ACFQMM_07530 [Saliphagus sp. GCM10025308]
MDDSLVSAVDSNPRVGHTIPFVVISSERSLTMLAVRDLPDSNPNVRVFLFAALLATLVGCSKENGEDGI